jgi:hypothetical protein
MESLGEFGSRMNWTQSNGQSSADALKEKEKALNQLYGYGEDEEKKNEMLKQFLRYLQESKQRDMAKLQQSRMI